MLMRRVLVLWAHFKSYNGWTHVRITSSRLSSGKQSLVLPLGADILYRLILVLVWTFNISGSRSGKVLLTWTRMTSQRTISCFSWRDMGKHLVCRLRPLFFERSRRIDTKFQTMFPTNTWSRKWVGYFHFVYKVNLTIVILFLDA